MKKYFLILSGSILFLTGCASKKVDLCTAKKLKCLGECKIEYKEGIKYNLCKTKCYTIYTGCKAKEKVEEGIEKIKGN
jgi:hypothetical protein